MDRNCQAVSYCIQIDLPMIESLLNRVSDLPGVDLFTSVAGDNFNSEALIPI